MTIKVENPRVFTGPVPEAWAIAREHREPVLVPQQFYADDRGFSLMNQLVGVLGPQEPGLIGPRGGQLNYSTQYPGVVKAWHRHHKQTDFWLCLRGHLKVGVHDEERGRSWQAVIGDRRPAVVIIPPPLWHGAATVGDEPAGLLYFVTHAYDPADPDEDRRGPDAFPGFPWAVQHR